MPPEAKTRETKFMHVFTISEVFSIGLSGMVALLSAFYYGGSLDFDWAVFWSIICVLTHLHLYSFRWIILKHAARKGSNGKRREDDT